MELLRALRADIGEAAPPPTPRKRALSEMLFEDNETFQQRQRSFTTSVLEEAAFRLSFDSFSIQSNSSRNSLGSIPRPASLNRSLDKFALEPNSFSMPTSPVGAAETWSSSIDDLPPLLAPPAIAPSPPPAPATTLPLDWKYAGFDGFAARRNCDRFDYHPGWKIKPVLKNGDVLDETIQRQKIRILLKKELFQNICAQARANRNPWLKTKEFLLEYPMLACDKGSKNKKLNNFKIFQSPEYPFVCSSRPQIVDLRFDKTARTKWGQREHRINEVWLDEYLGCLQPAFPNKKI